MFRFLKKKKNEDEKLEKERKRFSGSKDKNFLAEIQPQGGVLFKDKYIQKGDGYEACIHIYEYPTNVSVMWLERISSLYDVIVCMDVATMKKAEVVDSINKSMVEHQVRFSSAKKESERMEAEKSYAEMQSLYEKMASQYEVVKLLHVRLFVHSPTLDGLEKKVSNVMTDLTSFSFKGQIFLNETSWEWQSMFLPYEEQLKFPNVREGKGMPAETLGAGLPYHFSELNDPTGSYLGMSFSGGNVLFDLFHRDRQRRFYNGVVVGKMGAGKSTLLKKLAMDNHSRGNFIRGFDVTGEFETLVNAMRGYIISLDGSEGIINPLEIFRTVDTSGEKDHDPKKDEQNSFMQHLSKIAILYRFLAGSPTDEEIEEFKKLLRQFYDKLGFGNMSVPVTDLKAEEYPIFEDFLEFVREELYEDKEMEVIRKELSESRTNRLEKIELVIDNLVNTYGYLFNGHTTVPDFTNEPVIMFSIRTLTSLEENVFNAQMYNALNMIWDNLIQIGSPQMRRANEPDFDEDRATRLLVLIDEAHHMVNSENMLAVDFLTTFAREARKYFGGLVLASQSINDFVPEHAENETVSKIKTLFELTQYKFIMQQDTNSQKTLKRIFEGEISDSEVRQVPQLQQGDCLLSISGVRNIILHIEASDEELRLFKGGL